MDTAVLSTLSALAGSTVGAVASISTTWLTQHYQNRSQRLSQAVSRREHLFSDYVSLAAKLYADALTHNLTDVSVVMPLFALKAQIYIFANRQETESRAEEVLNRVVDTYYEPNKDFQSRETMEENGHDFLQAFTIACRDELMALRCLSPPAPSRSRPPVVLSQ